MGGGGGVVHKLAHSVGSAVKKTAGAQINPVGLATSKGISKVGGKVLGPGAGRALSDIQNKTDLGAIGQNVANGQAPLADQNSQQVAALGMGGGGTLSGIEKAAKADVPVYESYRDPVTGELKSQFAYDPSKSDAFNKLKEQAMAAPGSSPWAQMQLQKQGLEESNAHDVAATQGQTALDTAQGALMRTGGLSAGARERMADEATKNNMMAQQGVAQGGIAARLGIGENDINRQQQTLGNVANTELQGQTANIGTTAQDVQNKALFDMNRYNQQMNAYGAAKTAQAQANAANQSSKK